MRADREATAAATPAFTLAPAHPAMTALAGLAATTPPPPARTRTSLGARLARLEATGAPADVLAPLRMRADPAGSLLGTLAHGQVPLFEDALLTCLHHTLPLGRPFGWLPWLVDPARRTIVETSEVWPFVTGATGDEAVDELLFGSSLLEVDGAPVEVFAPHTRWHRAEALPRVAELYLRATTEPAPPLAAFVAWYRELHAHWFTIDATTPVPTDAMFPAEYAHWLTQVRRFAARAHRFVARAARSRRPSAVIVLAG